MIDAQNVCNGSPFEDHLERESSSTRFIPIKVPFSTRFLKLPLLAACTALVFILIVAGTAATAISFPPRPPEDNANPNRERLEPKTALDGDYKLLGPLLIMAGGFLLIGVVVMGVVMAKEAYDSDKGTPQSIISPMSLLGGPYFLAVPSSSPSAGQCSTASFAFARQLWTLPNAPLPDFAVDAGPLKGSRVRPSTALLNQPPFNPDAETPSLTGDS
ncbi:hypothetical protein JTE90_004114 [Oedothorax gibbosus]|uniref:Transmembrane protein 230 n=1 Tax=Oedothorax gibbosus TaxID=931172 RepID=A0AAV6V3S2_9ARAC|nr:hypothetical protein JTE90_004114 [Oedothorax gibbosus]